MTLAEHMTLWFRDLPYDTLSAFLVQTGFQERWTLADELLVVRNVRRCNGACLLKVEEDEVGVAVVLCAQGYIS